MMAALERSMSRVSFFISWAPAYFDIMFALSVAHDEDCWRHYFCNYVAVEDQMGEKQTARIHTVNNSISQYLCSVVPCSYARYQVRTDVVYLYRKNARWRKSRYWSVAAYLPCLVMASSANLPSRITVFHPITNHTNFFQAFYNC